MRSIITSVFCVFCLSIAGCGDDAGGGGGNSDPNDPVGTWIPDQEAMKDDIEKTLKPEMEKAQAGLKALGGMIDAMPDGPDKEEAKRKMAEGQKMMEDPLGNMSVAINKDGTYAVSMGGEVGVRGDWKLDGKTISFTETEDDGEPEEDGETETGTFENGKISFKPKGFPVRLVLKKK